MLKVIISVRSRPPAGVSRACGIWIVRPREHTMKISILLKIGSLVSILALTGCISTSHFQAWSGQQEFEGHGGAFTTQDGIEIYSVGAPDRKCQILGVLTTSTMSRASLIALFGNSWSTSSLVKEARARGGNAIILVSGNTQAWLTGGTDAAGNGQVATDANFNQTAVLVKYVSD